MKIAPRLDFIQWRRRLILFAVGALGVTLTLGVYKVLAEVEQDRLEHRFQLAASARAATIVRQLSQPLEHLTTLQRLFGSVARVDWAVFRNFTGPMLTPSGIRSYMWLPRQTAPEQSAFERSGRALWGSGFAFRTLKSDAQAAEHPARAIRFPVLYAMPEERGRRNAGVDFYDDPTRIPLIDQAIDSSLATASRTGVLPEERRQGALTLLLAPVYRGGIVPPTREQRRTQIAGLVGAELDLDALFAAAALSPQVNGFHIRLLDLNQALGQQVLANWASRMPPGAAPSSESPLIYAEAFEMAGQRWTVQIEAGAEWLEVNRPRGLRDVLLFGFLATLVLILYLRSLLGRSALVDSLERTHELDTEQRQAAEAWSREAQQRIEMLAHHDPLTGLPNRLLLRDRVEQAKAQASRTQSRLALMFLDLDRFKTINDSLGHPVGDSLLNEVVGRLKSCVRESDTISRQGGDEFIILLNDIRDGDAVARIADKIHQRMAEPLMLENHLLSTSFSIGVALYPDDGEDFDILLQKADTAMYHAKEAGRNGHRFFTEEMNQKVVEHLKLETQLRRALENKEFVLHYQPQLDLHEGGIIGAEALIRWNSPESGLVSPGKFIPVAEDSGLIVPIGAWVLNEACRQAKAWQDAGLQPFVVAVNLSAVQFRRLDLVNTVINALVLSDLDSQWLELELTESILIQDAETTLDAVRRLKALGVKLSVDDFGTGYSSLTYLKRFAVDKLKIDQSFVRDLLNDPDDAAIVRAIIQMAHSLKLKTIAEGVESQDLATLLRVFHCDEIQGYCFARPMPANELETFVRAHQAGASPVLATK
jgi:diguanylate cyclase (GGDEF)-like protein